VEDADYDAEDEAQEAVPEDNENAQHLEDGEQLIAKNDMWKMTEEFENYNERYQAENVEAPPRVLEKFAESVDTVPDGTTLTATQTYRQHQGRVRESQRQWPKSATWSSKLCGRC
jgi:molecular chaperone GrpE (heat shock protein)